MLPGNLDLIAAERHKEDLREAERMRLIAAIRRQQPQEPRTVRKVARWLGARLVSWGERLQGESVAPATPMAVAGAARGAGGCSQC